MFIQLLILAYILGTILHFAEAFSQSATSVKVDTSFLLPFIQGLLPTTHIDDLNIIELEKGNTNYCFKVVSRTTNENLLFLKHARSTTKRGNGQLSVDRMKDESRGMAAYRTVTPEGVVPNVLGFDEKNSILALECIGDEYLPMQQYLESGEDVDSDVSRVIGTIMGRSHARSHSSLISEEKRMRYADLYSNEASFELWRRELFLPTVERFSYDPPYELNATQALEMQSAVQQLLEIYMTRKESLIHADLHCENILVARSEGQPLSQRCKVVDFERCCLGPAGLDLGMFLGNYLYYYVSHSNPSVRRGLRESVLATIEAYRAAYRVQGQSMIARSLVLADLEADLAIILRHAVGFMALYPLFLLYSKPEINFLSLKGCPGYCWGDAPGRAEFVRKRHFAALYEAFALFLRGGSQQELVDGILSILQSDDVSLGAHQTEYWF